MYRWKFSTLKGFTARVTREDLGGGKTRNISEGESTLCRRTFIKGLYSYLLQSGLCF